MVPFYQTRSHVYTLTRPALRVLRNTLLGWLSGVPAVRSKMAWRLSRMVYR